MEIRASMLFICVFLSLLYCFWQRGGGRIPPGPIGLPYLGYHPFLTSEVYSDFRDLAKIYGPVFSVRLGFDLVVILNDLQSLLQAENISETYFHEGKHSEYTTITSCKKVLDSGNYTAVKFVKFSYVGWRMIEKFSSYRSGDSIKTTPTKAFILEVIRWIPPIPLKFLYITHNDEMLGDFFIPKHTSILANVWAINRDPKNWGADADLFRPERFLTVDRLQKNSTELSRILCVTAREGMR